MKQRTKNHIASVVVLSGAALFVLILYNAYYGPSDSDDLAVADNAARVISVPSTDSVTATSSIEYPTGPPSPPVRLAIPRLSVDAHVQHVGITQKNQIGIPSNHIDVAWYKLGVAPGGDGIAIIDGHLDNGLALPGVFNKLGTLNSGDEVRVVTEAGSTLVFVVDEVAEYPYDEVPIESILAQRGSARLALITCGGEWLKGERTYDQRVVVYAHYIGEK